MLELDATVCNILLPFFCAALLLKLNIHSLDIILIMIKLLDLCCMIGKLCKQHLQFLSINDFNHRQTLFLFCFLINKCAVLVKLDYQICIVAQ